MSSFESLYSATPAGDNGSPEAVYRRLRAAMVETQIVQRSVKDERVLAAMRRVPRHLFVPEDLRGEAYHDEAMPIGYGQTISQPYIVALMTELLALMPEARVLEIGTGSGYQTAILAEIAKEVYTLEIVGALALRARETLEGMGYRNVVFCCGDGYRGWPEHAPFDGVIVTAAPNHVPQPLVDQLAVGGRLVLPMGEWHQNLVLVRRTAEGVVRTNEIAVKFVPMTGEAQG